jgi:hypothetical protein
MQHRASQCWSVNYVFSGAIITQVTMCGSAVINAMIGGELLRYLDDICSTKLPRKLLWLLGYMPCISNLERCSFFLPYLSWLWPSQAECLSPLAAGIKFQEVGFNYEWNDTAGSRDMQKSSSCLVPICAISRTPSHFYRPCRGFLEPHGRSSHCVFPLGLLSNISVNCNKDQQD